MYRHQKLFSLLAFSAMMLGFTIIASAQYRDNRNNRNNRGNNGNNGYYVQDISSTLDSLKQKSRQFEKTLDRELDRSRYDGTRREDNLNRLAQNFKKAADDLEGDYNRRNPQKSADEARKMLNYASRLDRGLESSRLGRNNYTIMNAWTSIEYDLAVVARVYNSGYNGTYGRNRGGNNDRYPRNDDRRGDNRNTNGNYDRNLASTISSLKYKARNFEDKLDQDRYDRNGSNLEGLSDRFKNAVDDLYDEYQDDRRGNNSYNKAQKVLSLGEQLDREISNSRVGRGIKGDWGSIESDLKKIANGFNLDYRGNNGRFGGLGDIFRDFPF